MYPSKSSVASAHDEIHGTIEKFRHFINVFCRRHALSVLPIVKERIPKYAVRRDRARNGFYGNAQTET